MFRVRTHEVDRVSENDRDSHQKIPPVSTGARPESHSTTADPPTPPPSPAGHAERFPSARTRRSSPGVKGGCQSLHPTHVAAFRSIATEALTFAWTGGPAEHHPISSPTWPQLGALTLLIISTNIGRLSKSNPGFKENQTQIQFGRPNGDLFQAVTGKNLGAIPSRDAPHGALKNTSEKGLKCSANTWRKTAQSKQ